MDARNQKKGVQNIEVSRWRIENIRWNFPRRGSRKHLIMSRKWGGHETFSHHLYWGYETYFAISKGGYESFITIWNEFTRPGMQAKKWTPPNSILICVRLLAELFLFLSWKVRDASEKITGLRAPTCFKGKISPKCDSPRGGTTSIKSKKQGRIGEKNQSKGLTWHLCHSGLWHYPRAAFPCYCNPVISLTGKDRTNAAFPRHREQCSSRNSAKMVQALPMARYKQ